MFYNWYLLYLSLAVATVMDDQPYCTVRYRRLCQGKGRHVACQFPVPGPGESCVNYTQIHFTDDLQSFITHYVNRRRQRLAAGNERVRGGHRLPKPSVMMQVEWDRELATLAQRLADQCNFVHDDCRATVRYPYAGQTVGEVKWRRSSEPDQVTAQRAIRRVLDAWWGEKRRVLPEQLTTPFKLTAKGNVWGHFSQLAVWSLRAFGCGAVRHGPSYQKLLLVCDYSHTNMLGQRTVSIGPLQQCPIHTARRPRTAYPLLCASVRPNRINKQESYAPEEEDYEYDDDETTNYIKTTTNMETTTTKSTAEFMNLTMPVPPTIATRAILTLPTTTTTMETEETETTTRKTTTLTKVTEKVTYELSTKIDANVVHKDEEYDPLVHVGRQSFQHSTHGRLIDKLQHELEAGLLHNTENQHRRYHALIPEKYHIWKHDAPYMRFRENAESMDNTTIQTRGIRKFTAPQMTTTKKIAHNRNNEKYNTANRNEHDHHIISDGESDNYLETKYNPRLASKDFYEKPLHRQIYDIVEPNLDQHKHRKDPYEALIDAQRKKSQEKDSIRHRNEEIVFRSRADPLKRKDLPSWNQRKRVTVSMESQELKKDFEPPVQRKDVYEPVRQKWKHTRRRPVRPGAHALPLAMLASNANRPPERNAPVSLKMDRDDIDQLIKDTGFNPLLKLTKS